MMPHETPIVVGHAARFDKLSHDLGGFRERIKPGTFARTLKDNPDIRAFLAHDAGRVLGRTANGTLALRETRQGLAVELDPPATTEGRDFVTQVRRGDINQMSFGFRTIRDRWYEDDDGKVIRELIDVELLEVSAVSMPAYEDTDLAVRPAADRDFRWLTRMAIERKQQIIADRNRGLQNPTADDRRRAQLIENRRRVKERQRREPWEWKYL